MLFLYSILSIIAGATVVLGRILNAKLAEKIGTVQATVINYVVGIFFSIIFLVLLKRGFLPVYKAKNLLIRASQSRYQQPADLRILKG